jgi:hypothetical protein
MQTPNCDAGGCVSGHCLQGSEGVVCMCAVLMFECVCARTHKTSICVCENLYLHFLNFVCVRACNREVTLHTSSRVDGRLE